MYLTMNKLLISSILILIVQTVFAQYIPPVIEGYTRYNRDYYDKMISEGKPTQESPWGFQEISIVGAVEHNVSSIAGYIALYNGSVSGGVWSDGKTHIINFASGTYIIPSGSWYVMMVPSRTIIKGAGIGQTIFKATVEKTSQTALFALENCDDVVLRDFSFYNVTKDNKWSMLRGTDWNSARRENFLFENIEFDDAFGAFGVGSGCNYNFITYRGLRKRLGNTTARINANYSTPVPSGYQFSTNNGANVQLSGQLGVRIGNSLVFHDCVLGDNISATLDLYNNYMEVVGVRLADPLHDHSIKCPNGNHLYVHDSKFELTYTNKIIDNDYYNPTFFTHEGGCLANYHFKDLSFTRAGQIRNNGTKLVESEPFTLYDNRAENVSGDMVWENIEFEGYDNEIVGYPNVQTGKGFQAINYTKLTARAAQLKSGQAADFSITIQNRTENSKTELTGVYSWGQKINGTIDFPRDNRTFDGSKSQMESQPYVQMYNATVKDIYNTRLITTKVSTIRINDNNLIVYPNPTTEVINVKSSIKISSIVVLDSVKQEVIRINNPSDEIIKINAQHIKSGMYFIKVIYDNGKISMKKIVKN